MASSSNQVTNTSTENGGNNSSEAEKYGEDNIPTYKCNICYDCPKDPIVTKCGHLYCWPCLHRWLQVGQVCPVCRKLIQKETLIPILYRIGKTRQKDPRKKIPTAGTLSIIASEVCDICRFSPPVFAFIPCGHLTLCERCKQLAEDLGELRNCIICSTQTSSLQRIHY